ncbi:hypothetical protein D3C81_2332060 [compost metagenome]
MVRATEAFDIDEIMAFERRYDLEKDTIKELVIKGMEHVSEFENPQDIEEE